MQPSKRFRNITNGHLVILTNDINLIFITVFGFNFNRVSFNSGYVSTLQMEINMSISDQV